MTESGALGMLGNFQEESGCEPNRLEHDYSPYRTNSKEYVRMATSGEMTKTEFCKPIGFGLAQWTYSTRKAELWEFWKNSNKAFRIYNDLKSLGNEPVSLVSIIATQVRFLYQILVLSNKGYNEANIANELSAHPYRVKMGMEKVRNYSEYELEDMLDELSKLDIQIKTGDIDRFVGLELFILKMSN